MGSPWNIVRGLRIWDLNEWETNRAEYQKEVVNGREGNCGSVVNVQMCKGTV